VTVSALPRLSVLSGWSGFHDWLERWAPLAEWGVAAGTAALAVATFVLAKRAREEAAAVRAETEQISAQVAAALRAYVYPETTAEWVWGAAQPFGRRVLPLRNGGPGLALNVEGHMRRGTEGEHIALYAGSIAPGRALDARPAVQIEGGISGVVTWHGELRYGDLNGDQWTTRFTIGQGEGNQIVVEHESPARVETD
jgi:hypothetical protein